VEIKITKYLDLLIDRGLDLVKSMIISILHKAAGIIFQPSGTSENMYQPTQFSWPSFISHSSQPEEKLGAGGGSTSTPTATNVVVVVLIPESRGVVGQFNRKPTGSRVGSGVGLGVGNKVGVDVGNLVGFGVGNLVGLNVGTLVGAGVGDLVGVKRGSSGASTRSHSSLSLPLLTKYLIRTCEASFAFPAEPMGVII
jgi:hypothetical protein